MCPDAMLHFDVPGGPKKTNINVNTILIGKLKAWQSCSIVVPNGYTFKNKSQTVKRICEVLELGFLCPSQCFFFSLLDSFVPPPLHFLDCTCYLNWFCW